jgi:hypothetical protein
VIKAVDEALSKPPYLLIYLYLALQNEEQLVSKAEIKNLIDKHAHNINEFQYGLLKLSL